MRDKKRTDKKLLEEVIYRCNRVDQSLNRYGSGFSEFEADEDFRDSISFNIQQIGEVSDRLSDELKARTAEQIPWRLVKDMRNMFVHDYSSMDEYTIWKTAIEDVPVLKTVCEQELEKIRNNPLLDKKPEETDVSLHHQSVTKKLRQYQKKISSRNATATDTTVDPTKARSGKGKDDPGGR